MKIVVNTLLRMKLPRVSIIIPVYNVEKYIVDCLSSVVKQDYKGELECIIVDDCGSDHSMQLVDSFVSKLDNHVTFHVIHHSCNCGLSAARNTGFNASTGEFVFFLDSDDELYEDAISNLVNAQQRIGSVVTMGNWDIFDFSGNIISPPGGMYKNEIVFDDLHSIVGKPFIWGVVQNKLLKRDFIIENKLFQIEGILYEDDLWFLKVMCSIVKGNIFCIITPITYKYKTRQDSIVNSYSINHLRSKVKSISLSFDIAKNVPVVNKWYAVKSLEDFKRRALLDSLQRVTGLKVYKILYSYCRGLRLVNSRQYFSLHENTIFNKIFQLHYMLPSFIGCWLLFFSLKMQGIIFRINKYDKIKIVDENSVFH